MEENDVFFSAADNIPPTISQGKFGMASGLRKPCALSDSSNSIKKSKLGLGNIPSFGFKKPTPLGIKKQATRSIASIEDLTTNNNETNGKHRSNSVPSNNKKPSQPLKDLNEFYDFGDDGDDWYPEQEYLRDFSIRDLKDYIISSPIEINLEEEDELIPRINDDFTWTGRLDDSYQEQDDDDDENYPEIETIPSGYATRNCVENQVWVCDLEYEKDDPIISQPPTLKYDPASHSAFMSDYLSAINMLPSISSDEDSTDVSNDEDSNEI